MPNHRHYNSGEHAPRHLEAATATAPPSRTDLGLKLKRWMEEMGIEERTKRDEIMDSYGGIQRSKRGGIRTGVFLLVPSREHLSLAGLCPRLIWKEGHSVGQLQNGSVGDNEREIIAALSRWIHPKRAS